MRACRRHQLKMRRRCPFDSERYRSPCRVAAQDDFAGRAIEQMLHDFHAIKHWRWRHMFGSQTVINRNQFAARGPAQRNGDVRMGFR